MDGRVSARDEVTSASGLGDVLSWVQYAVLGFPLCLFCLLLISMSGGARSMVDEP